MADETELKCKCGQVVMAVTGKPILSVECLCADCQKAGAIFQSDPAASRILDDKGATPFVLYRKDKVRCLKGADQLREFRLSPDSKTRRVVASCCNTPIFLEFSDGHWLSMYGILWPEGSLPRLDLRTMTRDAPPDAVLSKDVPNPKTHTAGFYAKLFWAWMLMRFRTPKIEYVKGTYDGE